MKDGFVSRSPGSWSYVLPCDPDTGKPGAKWKTVHGTLTAAKRAKRNDLVQIEQGQFAPEPSKLTLGEYLAYFQGIKKMSAKRYKTYEGYVSSYNCFRKCLNLNLLLADVTTDMLQQAVLGLRPARG
jgi:hypothetical protein